MDYSKNTNDVKMVSFGKMNVSLAAFITLIVGILASLLIIFISPNAIGIIFAIYILLSVLLTSYNINCTQLGHCKLWAWTLTVLFIISVSSAALAFATKPALPKSLLSTKLNSKK